jgi:hypothetical protein
MHRQPQRASLLLRRARLLREQLATARRRGEEQEQVPQPQQQRQPITSVARTPDVQIETAPGDARPEGAVLMRDFLRASLYDPVRVWFQRGPRRPHRRLCRRRRCAPPRSSLHAPSPPETTSTPQHRGYFSRPVPPVGKLPEPIDFSKIVGQAEYRAVLARAHSAAAARAGGGNGASNNASAAAGAADAGRLLGGGDWLTPAEIFRPWYGAAVAHYVLEAHALEQRMRAKQGGNAAAAAAAAAATATAGGKEPTSKKLTPTMLHQERQPLPGKAGGASGGGGATTDGATAAAPDPTTTQPPLLPPLYIVEIGGGTGALALSILDHIRDHAPQGLYDRTTYVCVEVSSPLAAAQRSAVAVEGGHARAFVSVVGDATERKTWDAVAKVVPGMGVVRSGDGFGGGSEAAATATGAQPPPVPPRVFVLAMEVLDNLPHDRVERAAPGQPWLQTAVAPKPPRSLARLPSSSSRGGWVPPPRDEGDEGDASDANNDQQQQQWRQVLQPVTDPLVSRCARVVLPLLATSSGGDPKAPAVLAGIAGEGEGEGGEDEGEGAPPSPPSPPPSTKGWGWDPASWLRRLLAAATGEQLDPVCVWLPTKALALADALHGALPRRHTFVASDFDALPGVQVEGHGAPIVSGRRFLEEEDEESDEDGEGGDERWRRQRRRRLLRRRLVARDHAGVLVPWGTADIFFPTDFDALGALYVEAARQGKEGGAGAAARPAAAAAAARSAPTSPSPAPPPRSAPRPACQHMPTADFMAAFAESKRTRTLSGYNPLLQDFQNTRFFIGEAR